MNISNLRPDDIRASETQFNRPEKAPVKREESRLDAAPDRVNLSTFSNTLLNELDSTKKVEALRSAYEAGTYRVDPESLAKSLINAHVAAPELKPTSSTTQP